MSPNPVEYAEQTLGVHDVYSRAQMFAANALAHHEAMVEAADAIRRKQEQIADAEALLASRERGKNPEMSGTAFAEHMKIMVRQDPDLIQFRDDLLDLRRDHDWAEAQERGFRGRCEVEAGRLHELGGLLMFYAVAKIGPVLERAVAPAVVNYQVQHVPGDT